MSYNKVKVKGSSRYDLQISREKVIHFLISTQITGLHQRHRWNINFHTSSSCLVSCWPCCVMLWDTSPSCHSNLWWPWWHRTDFLPAAKSFLLSLVLWAQFGEQLPFCLKNKPTFHNSFRYHSSSPCSSLTHLPLVNHMAQKPQLFLNALSCALNPKF